MKANVFSLALLTIAGISVSAQTSSFADTAARYFQELEQTCDQEKGLWLKNLYGPVLLVDPQSRKVFASEIDSAGTLVSARGIFTGQLPAAVNISNTAINWNGTHWAMVMLPLPVNKNARLNLLSHELFHRSQPSLGFVAYNPNNPHLDSRDERIYLRLELEALKKAIAELDNREQKKHIRNALIFRKKRYQLFPGADSTENQMELNEGICEFTGLMMSGRTAVEIKAEFLKRIDRFTASPSYVRSFAYETTPVYGWLLNRFRPGWNREINKTTRLADFFIRNFELNINAASLDRESWIASAMYNGEEISKQEDEREQIQLQTLIKYRQQFIDSAHLSLPLIKMNMSFDYTRMVPLEPHGMVYPNIRITDQWGILEASNGVLISNDWSSATVSQPIQVAGNKASGNGWTLELNSGYQLWKDSKTGTYSLTKSP